MSRLTNTLIGWLAGAYSAAAMAVTPLSLPNEPLSVLSSRVDPNVMLLIDNSGSMRNIIWADGYDPDTAYPRWDDRLWRGGSYGYEGSSWDVNSGNVSLAELSPDNCESEFGSGFYEAVRRDDVSVRKCLALPDPVGSERTRYTGNYLNYLFETFPSGTDLRNGQIPAQSRMQVAREVAKSVVENVPDIRYGVSIFYTSQGGRIINECRDYTSANVADVLNAIDSIDATTNTPISETYYEITRYFRGLSSLWTWHTQFTSPIQYRCQRNFSILITDGEPTQDNFEGVSGLATDSVAGMDNRLPDWNDDGASFYLDDIAEFAHDLDMRTGGTDATGNSFDDPEFAQQNMNTYTVGFALDHDLLRSTAERGQGQYYTANNADQLAAALKAVLSDISDKVLGLSSAAVSQGPLNADTLTVFPSFNSADWSGELKAYRFDTDPDSDTYLQLVPAWASAAALIRQKGWNNRTIITNLADAGIKFRWGQFSAAQQAAYFDGNQALLQFLRGRESDEGSLFRDRAKLLGDIVYSSPQYVAAPAMRYQDADYAAFKSTHAGRTPMLYVGANDGMLHGFRADTGEELLAFIPGSLLGQLAELADPDYSHRFYVDGTPTVMDAYIGNRWRTVLVGGLNRGGQSIYALDVTDPSTFSEGNAANLFLWEFTDPDLGYSYSRPAVVQLENGTWAAVFGSGYNSTDAGFDAEVSSSGDAMLFVVDLASGTLIAKVSTGVGHAEDPTGAERPNGIGAIQPVDLDGNGRADTVYAGDLFGNLWKFDLSADNSAQWAVANRGKPLFVACSTLSCTADSYQPITAAPTVSRHPLRGVLVHFGTGKYLETWDKSDQGGLQTLYAIWDTGEEQNPAVTLSRSQLKAQSITYQGPVTIGGRSAEVRLTSRQRPNWASDKGWYLDLDQPVSERVITGATLRNGKIIYTTFVPVTDESDLCKSDSYSWLMELDAATGAALSYASFDLDGDRQFDDSDWINPDPDDPDSSAQPPSGIKMEGEKPHPSIVPVDPDKEIKVIDEATVIIENPGPGMEGRISWRERVGG